MPLERIEALTLARFQADGADGVELALVRDELAAEADAALADFFTAARRKLTVVFLLAIVVGSTVFARVAAYVTVLLFFLPHGA